MRNRIAVALALALSVAGCSDSPTEPRPAEAPRGLGVVRVHNNRPLDKKDVLSHIILIDLASAAEDTISEEAIWWSSLSFSPDGESVVYVHSPSGSAISREIWRADADGSNRRRLVSSAEALGGLAWSPDGRRIAYGRRSPETRGLSLWMMDASGSNQTLLFDPGEGTSAYEPRWSPDGRWILFGDGTTWRRHGGITLISPRTRQIRTVPFPPDSLSNPYCGDIADCVRAAQWTPEGRIGFVNPYYDDPHVRFDLWTMDPQGKDLRRITQGAHYRDAVWSPDGKMIAAVGADFDGSGLIHLLSADGELLREFGPGRSPAWRP